MEQIEMQNAPKVKTKVLCTVFVSDDEDTSSTDHDGNLKCMGGEMVDPIYSRSPPKVRGGVDNDHNVAPFADFGQHVAITDLNSNQCFRSTDNLQIITNHSKMNQKILKDDMNNEKICSNLENETTAKYLNDLLSNADVAEVSDVVLADILNAAQNKSTNKPKCTVQVPEVESAYPCSQDMFLLSTQKWLENAIQTKQPNVVEIENLVHTSHHTYDMEIPSTQVLIRNAIKANNSPMTNTNDMWLQDMEIPSTQVLMRNAIKANNSPMTNTNDMWSQDMEIPSTQVLMRNAIKANNSPMTNTNDMWSQDMEIPSTQVLMRNAIKANNSPMTNTNDMWSQDMAIPSTQVLMKNAIKTSNSPVTKIPPAEGLIINQIETNTTIRPSKIPVKSPPDRVAKVPNILSHVVLPAKAALRKTWIQTDVIYRMSDQLLNEVFNVQDSTLKKERFLYRKDSIAKEINKLFSGCVIYIDKPYMGKSFWRLQCYCSHQYCRNYNLRAFYEEPGVFSIEVDNEEVTHVQKLTRQVRRYERDEMKEKYKSKFPNRERGKEIVKLDETNLAAGSYEEVQSLCVGQKIRSEGLSEQDQEKDDIDDVEAMQTDDENTNFISLTLARKNFAVYIHSKSQQAVLHKLHQLRAHGIQTTVRLDATGNIARDIGDLKFLYHALTVNVKIKNDKRSTALPLTEQYNSRNKSKDISRWLFDFAISHAEFFENHPVLFDWLISDFSYANFHAVQKAFNKSCLRDYLNAAYHWIYEKISTGEFPEDFFKIVKVKMCFTHLMHTYGGMCRRHYGNNKGKQMPESKIVLEILAAMIKANDYSVILKLFRQLAILLKNEFINDDVQHAIGHIEKITSPIDLNDYDEDKLISAVDPDVLPENEPSLYKNNLFYIELAQIVDETPTYFNDEGEKVKNSYFNLSFLDKFLTRFSPLIPLWTSVLDFSYTATVNEIPDITLMNDGHNQPIETYFGQFKNLMIQESVHFGQPPLKMGRAITLSRTTINVTIKSINFAIPKSQLNTQKPRKEYVRKKGMNQSSVPAIQDSVAAVDQSSVPETQDPVVAVNQSSVPETQDPVAAVNEISVLVTDSNINLVSPDESSFAIAKENFKKRGPTKQFTYFQGRSIAKLTSNAKATIPSVDSFLQKQIIVSNTIGVSNNQTGESNEIVLNQPLAGGSDVPVTSRHGRVIKQRQRLDL